MTEAAEPQLVLIVDDEPGIQRALSRLLHRLNLEVITAGSGDEAMAALATHNPAVVLVDYGLPDVNGVDLTRSITREHPDLAVLGITGQGSPEIAAEMLRAGARAYFPKPFNQKAFLDTIVQTLNQVAAERAEAELQDMHEDRDDCEEEALGTLYGQSGAMKSLKQRLRDLQDLPRRIPLLVTGETGVGKTFAVKAFHALVGGGAFANLNATTLADDLEQSLFGNVRYTGVPASEGWCQKVGKGLVFIDEIGELPLDLQAKLLKLVEERVFQRKGGSETEVFQGRLVLATNRDLEAEVKAGTFRSDLWYRIKTFEVHIPPLRDRVDDIPALAWHFVAKYNEDFGRNVRSLTWEAQELLKLGQWEGNIRDLENLIAGAVGQMRKRTELTPEVLRRQGFQPERRRADAPASPEPAPQIAREPAPPARQRHRSRAEDLLEPRLQALTYKDAKQLIVDEFSRSFLRYRLIEANGNITVAAANSGMQRPNFSKLMRRFEVEKPTLRHSYYIRDDPAEDGGGDGQS